MYINGSSETKQIEDNHDLFKAARKLDNDAHLFITLFQEQQCGSSGEEEWDVDQSDSEEESDSESEAEEDGRYVNNLDATLKRFFGQGNECHHCSHTNGLVYHYSQNRGYSICESCYDDLRKKQKETVVTC